MDQGELKVGDTVQLKSGGPIMTIEKIGMYGAERKAACVWFEKSKKMQGVFSLTSLTAA